MTHDDDSASSNPLTTALIERRQRRKTLVLTKIFKLRFYSTNKRKALIECFTYTTHMKAAVLRLLHEEPTKPRDDGAIACVLALLKLQHEKEFRGNIKRTLGEIIRKKYKEEASLSLTTFPLASSIRDGIFKECAGMVWLWFCGIFDLSEESTPEPLPDALDTDADQETDYITPPNTFLRKTILTLTRDAIYAQWQTRLTRYEQATQQRIPFGRHRGLLLGAVSKRELRWLASRLLKPDQVVTLLDALTKLLYPRNYSADEVRAAGLVRHPWKTKLSPQRAVRASHLDQVSNDDTRDTVLLCDLSAEERDQLHDEMRDMQSFERQFALIREAVNILLTETFPRFPQIDAMPPDDERQKREKTHQDALNRLRVPFSRRSKKRIEEYQSDELTAIEERSRNQLLQAESALQDSAWQPIPLTRLIQQGPQGMKWRGYTVVFEPETMRYNLIAQLYGSKASPPSEPTDDQTVFLVNQPTVQLPQKPPATVLSFGLAYGAEYHDESFLRRMIQPDPLYRIATLKSADITTSLTIEGKREFYAHIAGELPITYYSELPTRLLGVHHHNNGYTYALTELSGDLIYFGELIIPDDVRPTHHADPYLDNYVYAVARALCTVALDDYEKYGTIAYIGIEDTSWKKPNTLQRGYNQWIARHPTVKILQTLQYKALEYHLIEPLLIHGIAPTRLCGTCGHLHAKDDGRIFKLRQVICPDCDDSKRTPNNDDDTWMCLACRANVGCSGSFFNCSQCNTTLLARKNTALAVARRIPESLNQWYASRMKRQKKA